MGALCPVGDREPNPDRAENWLVSMPGLDMATNDLRKGKPPLPGRPMRDSRNDGTNPLVRTLWSMSGGSECTDEALWQLAVNGDGDAFGALFDRHRDRVLGHALKILRSTHLAEDITAVVFYEAWRRREFVRVGNGSIVAWLLVTANNTIRNHVRERRRYSSFLSQLPEPAAVRDIADMPTSKNATRRLAPYGRRSSCSNPWIVTCSPCA